MTSPLYSIAPAPSTVSKVPNRAGPGPGAYVLKDGDVHTSKHIAQKGHSFGSPPRTNAAHPGAKKTTIGPGRYTSTGVTRTGHAVLGSSGGFTFGGRRNFDLTKAMVV